MLLKKEKLEKWHRCRTEMVEHLKLLCDGELAFGGEGAVCERKVTYSQGRASAVELVSWAEFRRSR